MDVEKKPRNQPKNLPRIQASSLKSCTGKVADTLAKALAAIGQCRLMTLYDSLFEHLRQPIAQILLTRNDIADVWSMFLPSYRRTHAFTEDPISKRSKHLRRALQPWRDTNCQRE